MYTLINCTQEVLPSESILLHRYFEAVCWPYHPMQRLSLAVLGEKKAWDSGNEANWLPVMYTYAPTLQLQVAIL